MPEQNEASADAAPDILKCIRFIDGKIHINTTQTAEVFGVTPKTLAAWLKKGAPQTDRGWWDIAALIEWRFGGESGTNSAEARKSNADANFREIKARKELIALDLLEGRLIEREEVDRQWTAIGLQIKNALLMWVKSLTPHLAHQDMRTCEKVLGDGVYDLLSQLSSKSRFTPKKVKSMAGRPKKGT